MKHWIIVILLLIAGTVYPTDPNTVMVWVGGVQSDPYKWEGFPPEPSGLFKIPLYEDMYYGWVDLNDPNNGAYEFTAIFDGESSSISVQVWPGLVVAVIWEGSEIQLHDGCIIGGENIIPLDNTYSGGSIYAYKDITLVDFTSSWLRYAPWWDFNDNRTTDMYDFAVATQMFERSE